MLAVADGAALKALLDQLVPRLAASVADKKRAFKPLGSFSKVEGFIRQRFQCVYAAIDALGQKDS